MEEHKNKKTQKQKVRTVKQRSLYRKKTHIFIVSKSNVEQPVGATPTPVVSSSPTTVTPDQVSSPKLNVSSSSKKVQSKTIATPIKNKSLTGYRIIDLEILADVFNVMVCPSCEENCLSFTENAIRKMGLSDSLRLKCSKCDFSYEFSTSKDVSRNNNKSYNINKRFVYSMRSCGQ